MDTQQALEFVRAHGVVLVSAKGPAPRLTDAIAGEPVKGSWWGHPRGKQIFAVLDALNDCEDILVCRLLQDKLTMVHRRLWPALAALAPELPPAALARVVQEHTASGKHVNRETPFPDWLPPDAAAAGARMSSAAARTLLGL
jgi:phosphoketolase